VSCCSGILESTPVFFFPFLTEEQLFIAHVVVSALPRAYLPVNVEAVDHLGASKTTIKE